MEQKHLHYGHRERLRNQVKENGLDCLHEHQVLEYLLTFTIPLKDTNDIAHRLINKFGSFAGVLEADVESLKQVKGVGDVVAHFLSEYRDFYYYYQKTRPKTLHTIKDLSSAKKFFMPYLFGLDTEQVYLIGIDGSNKVTHVKHVARGLENQANVSVREVSDIVFTLGSPNFMIGHNHPSGLCVPSAEDNKFTKSLAFAMVVNNINFMDHVIVGTDGIFSYHQSGMLQDYKKEAEQILGISASYIAQGKAKYGED